MSKSARERAREWIADHWRVWGDNTTDPTAHLLRDLLAEADALAANQVSDAHKTALYEGTVDSINLRAQLAASRAEADAAKRERDAAVRESDMIVQAHNRARARLERADKLADAAEAFSPDKPMLTVREQCEARDNLDAALRAYRRDA